MIFQASPLGMHEKGEGRDYSLQRYLGTK